MRLGSSPLARGTRGGDSRSGLGDGLIPARAGNTALRQQGHPHAEAHPRSRGEHDLGLIRDYRKKGSSPLARGTRHGNPIEITGQGLIPARAGNTLGGLWSEKMPRAHPRSRGEHD